MSVYTGIITFACTLTTSRVCFAVLSQKGDRLPSRARRAASKGTFLTVHCSIHTCQDNLDTQEATRTPPVASK